MEKISKIVISGVPTLKKDAKIGEAAKLIIQKNKGCVVIIDNEKPIGIVTEFDFVKNAVSGKKLKEPISNIMSTSLVTMSPETGLDEALKIIDTKSFRVYPVVQNGRLEGIVTKKDIVHAFSDNLKFHRNIQNFVLVIFVLFELFIFVFSKYFSFCAKW